MSKRKYCTMPWKRMDVTTDGKVHLCVKGWLKDEDAGSVGNLQLKSGKEIWHGKKAQEFRESILDGSYKYCCSEKCPWLNSPEEPGSPMVYDELDVPEVPEVPEILNAAYDLTCNLFCMSCRKDVIIDPNFQTHDKLKKRIQDMGDIDCIILIGSGDPFSSPHAKRWLRSGEINAKKVMFHTNATLFTKDMWDSFPPETKAKVKRVEVSIDAATKETYEEVRRGSSWEVLNENLKFLAELRKSGQLEYLKFSFVAYRPNFREMPLFVEMAEKYAVDDVFFSRVEDWFTFGCGNTELMQVHLPEHKDHAELKRVLNDPALKNPIVRIGNLRRYKEDDSK